MLMIMLHKAQYVSLAAHAIIDILIRAEVAEARAKVRKAAARLEIDVSGWRADH